MTLTEEDVRRIVREEIGLALESLSAAAAQEYTPYETGEIKEQALAAVSAVARQAYTHLNHAPDCGIRTDSRYGDCTCDAEEGK